MGRRSMLWYELESVISRVDVDEAASWYGRLEMRMPLLNGEVSWYK